MSDWASEGIERVGAAAEYMRQQKALANFRAFIVNSQPDKASKANALARWTNLPGDTVEDQYAFVDALRRGDREGGILAEHPRLYGWMQDPRNAKAAQGDILNLATTSRLFDPVTRTDWAGAAEYKNPWLQDAARRPRTVEDIMFSLRGAGDREDARLAALEANRPKSSVGSWIRGIRTDVTEGFKQAFYGTAMFLLDAMGAGAPDDENVINPNRDQSWTTFERYRTAYRESSERQRAARPVTTSWYGDTLYSGLSSTAQFVPALVAAPFTDGVSLLTLIAAQTGTQAYGKYRERGGTRNEALVGGVGEGLVEGVTEAIPLNFLFDRWGKQGIKGFVGGFLMREMLTEQAATLGQDALDTAIANPQATWDKFWADRPKAALDTAVATLMMTGLVSGTSATASAIRHRAGEFDRQVTAMAGAKFMDSVLDVAQASTLLKNDPEGFAQFVQQQAEGSALESVYVPAEAVRSFFQSAGTDYRTDPFWSKYQDQLDQALPIGGDIVVPIGEAVAAFAQAPEQWDKFRDSVRLSPGGMDLGEARSLAEQYEQVMSRRGAEASAADAATRDEAAPVQRVYDAVFTQARQAGNSVSAARAYADLFAARYATRAQQRGTDAWTLFQQSVGGIVRDLPAGVRQYRKATAVEQLVNVMRRDRAMPSERAQSGPSLLEWIAAQGGVEDVGGDLQLMGASRWHLGHPGRRKLLRKVDRRQADMLGGGEGRANTPDALFARAIEAGYFPEFNFTRSADFDASQAPDVASFKAAIENELRGSPLYSAERQADAGTEKDAKLREDAAQLREYLETRGIDPDTASIDEIRAAMKEGEADSPTRQFFEQAGTVTERMLYQTQPEHPAFYSALLRSVEGAGLRKGSAEQWKGTLRNAAGVKAEELEWSGLLEWLDEQPGQIARADVETFLREGGIRVSEIVLGGSASDAAVRAKAEQLHEDYVRGATAAALEDDPFFQEGPPPLPDIEETEDGFRYDGWTYDTREDAEEAQADDEESSRAQWENDRRIEIENTFRGTVDVARFEREARELLGAGVAYSEWTTTGNETPTYRELLLTLPLGEGKNPRNAPDTHWDQPGVVAHVRFQGKVDTEGNPVLFVEEVQSDWHQKGRDEGYERAPDPEAVKDAREKLMKAGGEHMAAMRAIVEFADSLGILPADEAPAPERGFAGFVLRDQPLDEQASYADRALRKRMVTESHSFYHGEEAVPAFDGETEAKARELRSRLSFADIRQREAEQAFSAATRIQGIPNAPFKSSWPALVMKRVIRWAADNGYTRVAWTTGDQQADRYDLGERVGSFTAFRNNFMPAGQVAVRFENEAVVDVLLNAGLVTDTEGGQHELALMTRDQLVEVFGADLGGRIHAAGVDATPFTPASFNADDMRVGGEGMKAFYDRNLVNITNDLIKKYGAKVAPIGVVDATTRADVMMEDARRARAEADALASVDGRRAEQLYADANAAEATAKQMRDAATVQQWGFEVTPKMADAARAGFALFQGGEDKPRARIDFASDGRALIVLFDGADLSSLLHESGHLWIEELRADALRPDAPDQVKADWEIVRAWFADNGYAVAAGDTIPVDAHELWARGMERYLMEGKAPTSALQRAFSSFRSWLLRIYQVVANLNSNITPEVRGVMDRMLATEDAMLEASNQPEAVPLLTEKTRNAIGVTDAEFSAFRRSVETAKSEAFDALLYKTMEAIRRERTAEWRRQREVVAREIEREVRARPEFRALAILRGQAGGERVQINRASFVEQFGSDALAAMPRGVPPLFADKGGIVADVLAEMSGFPTGQALVDMLIGVETRQRELKAENDRRSVLQETIDLGVDQAMRERHGDPLADGSIEEEALAAIQSEKLGEALATEIRFLSRRANRDGVLTGAGDLVPTPLQVVREWAAKHIREGKVSENATAAALARYQRAAAKAARAAEAAVLEGKFAEAFRQKQAQLYNHALFAEAKAAKEAIDKIVRRLGKLARAKALPSMDQDYLDRIHDLLEAYDFRPRSQRERNERAGFSEWVRQREEAGEEVYVPPRLADFRAVNFKDATVEELTGLDDMVQSIEFLGRRKKKMQLGKDKRDYEEFINSTLAETENAPSRKFRPVLNRPASFARTLMSSGVTIERMADFLDNYNPNGGFNQVLVRGSRDAANLYAKIANEVLEPITRAYMGMKRAQRSRLFERITVPEFMTIDPDTREIKPVTMLRMDLVAVALNTGTASNLDKLIRGENIQFRQMPDYQLTEAKLMRALNRELTAEDWAFVRSLWQNVGKLWPHIERSEREITGVVPERVETRQVETVHGTFEGGYWPAVYDPDPARARFASFDATRNADKDAQQMFGQIGRTVGTNKGHTIARTEYAAPMLFSLEAVLFKHVRRVATRAAYGGWVREALKFLGDPRIEEAVSRKLGREYYAQFHPWLRGQINDASLDTADLRGLDKIMRTARTNATAVGLVFRFTTLLTQVFGVANSMAEIGPLRVLDGYVQATVGMGEGQREALSLSEELQRRAGEFDRDVQAALRDIASAPRTAFARTVEPGAKVKDAFNGFGFWLIGMVQLHLVDIPLWLGAYRKATAEGMDQDDAINFADKSVRKSQGSGMAKDLAAIQRGTEPYRIFTTFYTYFGTVLNYQWEVAQALRSGNVKRAAAKTWWVMIVGPMLTAMVMDGLEGLDDDEEDPDGEGWFSYVMRNVFFGLWGGVPILREFANKWNREMSGKYTPDPQTPAQRIVGSVQGVGKDAIRGFGQTDMYREAQATIPALPDQKEPSERWLRHVIEASGMVTGLGTGQLATSLQYAYDVSRGAQNPEDAADVAVGVIKGPQEEQE